MFNYSDRIVAITGASSGIGLEIARQFYLAGASLALCSRSAERVRRLRLGRRRWPQSVDCFGGYLYNRRYLPVL